MAAILEGEDVDLLEVDVARMKVDRVPLRKALSNVGLVDVVITSPKSVGRNLIDLIRYSYLILVLLLRVVLLRILHLLFLTFSLLYYRRRSKIDSDR